MNLSHLRALAEKATPGPWAVRMGDIVSLTDSGQGFPLDYYPDSKDIAARCDCGNGGRVDEDNAEFIAAARSAVPELLDECERRHVALTKINAIRNSIVGMQGFNFSEHAYPLVAALNAAGYMGADYPEARANLGTLIEQRDSALAESTRLREQLDAMTKARDEACELAGATENPRASGAECEAFYMRLAALRKVGQP